MAASLTQIKHKRQRENISDCYSGEYQDDQNLQKRSRDGLLSDLFSTNDGEGDAIEDDLVLQVIKNLQEEINGTTEILPVSGGNNQMGKPSRITDEGGERVSSYEYLVNATDDQLGISPSPPLSVEENDNQGISNKFWSDLFENPSSSTGQSVDLLRPLLLHCYSYNYRDYVEYNMLLISGDQQEWMQEAFADLALQGVLNLL